MKAGVGQQNIIAKYTPEYRYIFCISILLADPRFYMIVLLLFYYETGVGQQNIIAKYTPEYRYIFCRAILLINSDSIINSYLIGKSREAGDDPINIITHPVNI